VTSIVTATLVRSQSSRRTCRKNMSVRNVVF